MSKTLNCNTLSKEQRTNLPQLEVDKSVKTSFPNIEEILKNVPEELREKFRIEFENVYSKNPVY